MKLDERAIAAHLRKRLPDAMAVYLFGSVASGDAGPESDVDLAVLNDGPLDPVFVWDIACELANVVDAHVDLVDLRTASTVLQHQIVAKGRADRAGPRQAARKMVGFRNIAVHDDQALLLPIVVAVITKHLDDFTAFSAALLAHER